MRETSLCFHANKHPHTCLCEEGRKGKKGESTDGLHGTGHGDFGSALPEPRSASGVVCVRAGEFNEGAAAIALTTRGAAPKALRGPALVRPAAELHAWARGDLAVQQHQRDRLSSLGCCRARCSLSCAALCCECVSTYLCPCTGCLCVHVCVCQCCVHGMSISLYSYVGIHASMTL